MKEALIIWGGWEGHAPKLIAKGIVINIDLGPNPLAINKCGKTAVKIILNEVSVFSILFLGL